jgi:hypothetical protein
LDLSVPDSQRPFSANQSREASGRSPERPDWNRDIKAYYDAIASEPIPEEFEKLMAILAKAIRK